MKNSSDVQIGDDDVEWADYIFVMENIHKKKLQDKFGKVLNKQKIICLAIPDNYKYMDEALVKILEMKVPAFVR